MFTSLLTGIFLLGIAGMAHAYSITPLNISYDTTAGTVEGQVLLPDWDGAVADDCLGDTCWATEYKWTLKGNKWEADYPNPSFSDIEAIVGGTDFSLLYKNDVDGNIESGSYVNLYKTTYSNTPSDPANALIEWEGTAADDPIDCPECYLLLKDGNEYPIWYLYDIGDWNGKDDIDMTGFWPGTGAISHVQIVGAPNPVPEPATMLLFGAGLAALAGVSRRKSKK